MAEKKKYLGVDIREVWDYRLSSAVPQLLRDLKRGTWVVQVWAKQNPDYDPAKPETLAKPLFEHDTGIAVVEGDEHDADKVSKCYEVLRKVRDEFSLPGIETRKPIVAELNALQAKAHVLNAKLEKKGAK